MGIFIRGMRRFEENGEQLEEEVEVEYNGDLSPHAAIAYLSVDTNSVDAAVPFDSTRLDTDSYFDAPNLVIPVGLGGLYMLTLTAYIDANPDIIDVFLTLGTATGYEDVFAIKRSGSGIWVASAGWIDVLDEGQSVGVFVEADGAVDLIAHMLGGEAGTTFAISYIGPATSS